MSSPRQILIDKSRDEAAKKLETEAREKRPNNSKVTGAPGHWYKEQSPSRGWAEEEEDEEKSQDEEEYEPFIRDAYKDPFLRVLNKLADLMDRPARPAPPAWLVFTDKYQDFPKWHKDIVSYLKDYCSSLRQETKVLHLKEHCFSKKTVALLDSFDTLDSIFRRLERIYKQPACYAVEVMKPFQNQNLKADNDAVGLEIAYQTIVKVLRETIKLDQVRSLAGPEYVWRMTSTLSQHEIGLWKGFKRQYASRYDSEFNCFFDFSQDRLEYWSDLADEARAMAIQYETAPAAKPAGGSSHDGYWS